LTVLHRIVHEEPPPPRQFRPDLDPGLEAVVLKALRKEPAARHAGAAAFAAALRGCVVAVPAPAVPPPSSPTASRPATTERLGPPRPVKPSRWVLSRRLGWLMGDALVMLGAVGIAMMVWTHLLGERRIEVIPVLGVGFICCVSVFLGMQLWQVI